MAKRYPYLNSILSPHFPALFHMNRSINDIFEDSGIEEHSQRQIVIEHVNRKDL